ncbi:MAG: DUF4136 domain-containing protein [Flavobacteriaceae bacterium]
MKHLLIVAAVVLSVGCSSIRVFSDHDASVDFKQYTSYAFFKPGIEEVNISELDKRRILKAIENAMNNKNLTLSSEPDLLVNIAVKATDRVTINNYQTLGWGWGWNSWAWNPWGWGGNINSISKSTRGELFIDIIDAKTKLLIWQGKGYGGINEYNKNRDKRIALFVTEILNKYPPEPSGN